ncbi:SDR family NAD(P)-dependent oxidoreductase [Hyphococcus sp.]|uniref:SDR family NAD(P)-dependent oxidoreductase n=1 Tax=Hyphococcus sp. TaxID=2038636 RepID=UPI003CCB8D56
MIDLQLDGAVALVTGASRGLGRAIASALAEQGASVLATARSQEDLSNLEKEGDGNIRSIACDMKDIDRVRQLPSETVNTFGKIDIIVNNAGIAPAGSFITQSEDLWRDVMTVNIEAPAAICRAAGQYFIEQKSGKVINIASTSGILGKPQLVAYSASKGAMLQFTKALAGEWAGFGIQVNAIAPGAFETDAQQAVLDSPEIMQRRLKKIPAKRMGRPDEIGPLACYLASPASNFVTGSVYVIDGGESGRL